MIKKSAIAVVLVLPIVFNFAHPVQAETPLTAEVSPPGDIPDNQAFVVFTSPAGYSIKLPEGWARKDEGNKTTFSDKYNHLTLLLTDNTNPIDEAFAKTNLIPELEKTGRAVGKVVIKKLPLKSGPMLVLEYDSNSEPNAVTNKQIREENERVYFVKGNQLVTLTLSAPKGADNVDQWKLMVDSFRWK